MGESCEQGRVKVIGEQPLRGHVDGSEGETRGQGNGTDGKEEGGDGTGGTGTENEGQEGQCLGQGCGTGQWGWGQLGLEGWDWGFPSYRGEGGAWWVWPGEWVASRAASEIQKLGPAQ